jgi:RNA polymerase sigma factor (sigma-70 family)
MNRVNEHMPRYWTLRSVSRAAALARKGATRKEMVDHYFQRYGRKWKIESRAEMEQLLFTHKKGRVAIPGLWFQGKDKKTINRIYQEYYEKTMQTREKMAAAKRGKKLGAQTKEKISVAKKGMLASPVTRAKMSRIRKGKKKSLETRARMSKAQKGRIISQQTREKLSKAHTGKKHSARSKRAMSKAQKGRKPVPVSIETKRKLSIANTGRTHTPETRAKMSQSQKARREKERGELLRISRAKGLLFGKGIVDTRKKKGHKKISAMSHTAETRAIQREQTETITRSFKQLSPTEQTIAHLVFFEHKTMDEIARKTGKNKTTVERHYRRLRGKLRKIKALQDLARPE